MLMQLKPGRHGSESDVHSLMSAEGGAGDREPAVAPPRAPASESRAALEGGRSWAPDQPRSGWQVRMSGPCMPGAEGFPSQNPSAVG